MQVDWNGFRPSGLLCDTGARTRKRICFVRTRPADARRVHAVYDPPDSAAAFKDPYVAWMRCRGCDLVVYLGLENPNVYLRRSKRPLMLLLGIWVRGPTGYHRAYEETTVHTYECFRGTKSSNLSFQKEPTQTGGTTSTHKGPDNPPPETNPGPS